jgi:hypothetical protein
MKKCFFLSTKHSSILHGALVGAGTFQPFMEHETNSPELAMLIVKVFAAAKLQLSQVGVLLGTHLTSPHTHANGILPGGFLYVLDQQQQHMCKSLFV